MRRKEYTLKEWEGGVTRFSLEDLNPEQREAVTHGEGPALVIAGAGSGKTRVITYRVAYLVEKGISPDRILLATFTNRAAREMLRRASALTGTDLSLLWGGTFHHIANLILRKHARIVGYENNYNILDREDSKELLGSVRAEEIKKEEGKLFPREEVLIDILSFSINTGKSVEEVIGEKYPHLITFTERIERIFQLYGERKRKLNLMDFDDLLLNLLKVLKIEKIKERYSQYFLHILVDEFQDTNFLQVKILDELASYHQNIMVVGDDSQSIYSFRGARFQNLLEFPQKYPHAKIYTIETNYRSTPEILSLANCIISSSRHRFKKALRPVKGKGEIPKLVIAQDVFQQASFVAEQIIQLREEGIPLEEMAVLYRNHFHSMELQMEFMKRGIPFHLRSGLRFFEQAHIKDVVSYLKIIHNPYDELAWKRVLKLQPGIGKITSQRLWEFIRESPFPLKDILKFLPSSRRGEESLRNLHALLDSLSREGFKENPSLMIEEVLNSGYAKYLESNYPDWISRMEDIKQLSHFALNYPSLEAFLSELSIMGGLRTEDIFPAHKDEEAVILSTVHQAKGLEWKVVFIIWLAENHFPYYKSTTPEEIEEERRLFYVAITRAKDKIFLLYPLISGSDPYNFTILKPSPFIEEISPSSYEEWYLK